MILKQHTCTRPSSYCMWHMELNPTIEISSRQSQFYQRSNVNLLSESFWARMMIYLFNTICQWVWWWQLMFGRFRHWSAYLGWHRVTSAHVRAESAEIGAVRHYFIGGRLFSDYDWSANRRYHICYLRLVTSCWLLIKRWNVISNVQWQMFIQHVTPWEQIRSELWKGC